MCKTYHTVYKCGHYKVRHKVCEHGSKKEKTLCDGTANAHGNHSTKIQFMCEFEGCDGRKKLKREGPDGKYKVETMHLRTILTCRLNRNTRISLFWLILWYGKGNALQSLCHSKMNYFII